MDHEECYPTYEKGEGHIMNNKDTGAQLLSKIVGPGASMLGHQK
jgi:hypothetical protein